MSRTYRRKGFVREKNGCKVCHPDYAEFLRIEPFAGHKNEGWAWRLPSKEEAFRNFKILHLKDRKTPDQFYRKTMLRSERSNYKQQFRCWLNNPDFEIQEQLRLRNTRYW